MKFKAITLSLLTLVMFASCSDDDSSSSNCEADDTGFLQLTIPSSTNRTSVLLTEVGTNKFTEEIIAANKTSATVEVDAGVYTVSVDQINAAGEATTNTFTFSASIEQCDTVEKTVVFTN